MTSGAGAHGIFRAATGLLLGAAGIIVSAGAPAVTGEAIYKAKCSLCHDSGAGLAPRIGNAAEWMPRFKRGRKAIYETALKGKPDTAMMAKGGYSELSDAELGSAVDYMLAKSGYDERFASAMPEVKNAGSKVPAPKKPVTRVDDKLITAGVAEALRQGMAPPGAKVETYAGVTTVRGVGIKIETRNGVVVLRGTLKDAESIHRAGEIAGAVDGVQKVDNKLISAAIFEWD